MLLSTVFLLNLFNFRGLNDFRDFVYYWFKMLYLCNCVNVNWKTNQNQFARKMFAGTTMQIELLHAMILHCNGLAVFTPVALLSMSMRLMVWHLIYWDETACCKWWISQCLELTSIKEDGFAFAMFYFIFFASNLYCGLWYDGLIAASNWKKNIHFCKLCLWLQCI